MSPTRAFRHRSILAVACTLPAALATAAAHAQLHDTDIIMSLDDNSRIVLATASDAAAGSFDSRVFVGDLGSAGAADDPGFDSFSGTFPPNTVLRFDLVGSLKLWDGAAFPSAPAPSTMSVFKFGQSVTTPQDDSIVTGLNFGQASSAGRFHHHVDFELNPPLSAGVYLIGLRLVPSNTAAVVESDPFWLVWDFGADPTQVTAARDWARENLAGETDPCVADWNADGTVSIFDIIAFLTAFEASSPTTDIDASGTVNIFDVIAFLGLWSQG